MAQTGEFARRSLRWAVLDGIKWAEAVKEPASPVEEARDDGTRCIRTLWCRWEDRVRFARRLVGAPTIQAVSGTPYLSRRVPHAYPEWLAEDTNKPFLFCNEVQRIEPVGVPEPYFTGRINQHKQPEDVATYFLAKLTCVYTTHPYEILSDVEALSSAGYPDESTLKRYVTMQPRPAGQALPLPLQMFLYVWDPANRSVPGQPSTIVPEHDWQITWHRVPTSCVGTKMVNPNAISYPIDELLGKVNATDFPTDAQVPWPVGTLLLTGAGLRPYKSPFGQRLWDVTYFIKAFNPGLSRTPVGAGGTTQIGHNHIIMPPTLSQTGKVEYAEVTTDGATNVLMQTPGKTIHDYGEFKRLFRVPA